MTNSDNSPTPAPALSPIQKKLAELLAKARADKDRAALAAATTTTLTVGTAGTSPTTLNSLTLQDNQGFDRFGKVITYNAEQLTFIRTATTGASCILIGAAGTGKTTTANGAILSLIQADKLGVISSDGHKSLVSGAAGIVCVSFTRRAVSNLRRNVPDDLKANCMTIHALLEYEPVYYSDINPATGEEIKTMRFEPTRNIARPLPASIRCILIDEASMVDTPLFTQLVAALPSNCQFIFLGDIQQLPPVFGSAILGFKMLELTTVELTQVYRQALESPIIRLAHRILSGKPIPVTEYADWKVPAQLTLHPWKKQINAEHATQTMAKFLTTAMDAGAYIPEDDMVLIPFNKSCGTIEVNKHIAQHCAKKYNRCVYEIIAGFNKHYLSVGDKILCDKEDGLVLAITENPAYTGAAAQAPSPTLDYWGCEQSNLAVPTTHDTDFNADEEIDFFLAQAVALGGSDEEGERVRQASHTITVQLLDSERTITVSKAGDVNNIILSYALTVHKSQGSEWRKVFLMLHQSHNSMIFRELMYTAVTRAREELYVICEPDTFTKGITTQRIKGETLADKAIYFQGKLDSKGGY